MVNALLYVSTFLSAIVMSLTLAHALELPGKMRLNREQYYAVQSIYYPGFTIAGLAEPLAVVSTAAALVRSTTGSQFQLVAAALLALVMTQLLFWGIVQPTNREWLSSVDLSYPAEHFFETARTELKGAEWTKLRDRWETGHLIRTAFATPAFALLLLAATAPLRST